MNKLLIPVIFIAIFLALYEQSLPHSNPYIMIVSIAVFVFGMAKLMAKVPSRNQEDESDDDNKRG